MRDRLAKLQPWYHVTMPQCDTTTLAKERCIFSARYVGSPPKGREINLCKTHADMADFPVRPIKETRIVLR